MITLKTLDIATPQQVFEQIAKHLLKQNAQSKNYYNGNQDDWYCAYLSDDGKKCAVGCLIGDDEYSPSIENTSWWSLTIDSHNGIYSNNCIELIEKLQRIHDNFDVSSWKEKLKEVGESFNLNTTFLNNIGKYATIKALSEYYDIFKHSNKSTYIVSTKEVDYTSRSGHRYMATIEHKNNSLLIYPGEDKDQGILCYTLQQAFKAIDTIYASYKYDSECYTPFLIEHSNIKYFISTYLNKFEFNNFDSYTFGNSDCHSYKHKTLKQQFIINYGKDKIELSYLDYSVKVNYNFDEIMQNICSLLLVMNTTKITPYTMVNIKANKMLSDFNLIPKIPKLIAYVGSMFDMYEVDGKQKLINELEELIQKLKS